MATNVTVSGPIQLKRGKAEAWQRNNPILLAGELGFETDTYRFKIGDGETSWNDLKYQDSNSVLNAQTKDDFPALGNDYTIYKAAQEQKIYQWNNDINKYEPLFVDSPIDVNIIYGGNANGTT